MKEPSIVVRIQSVLFENTCANEEDILNDSHKTASALVSLLKSNEQKLNWSLSMSLIKRVLVDGLIEN